LLAVVLVTWNVRDLALDALCSLYEDLASSGLSADVYVVDSGSTDGTLDAIAAAFPQTKCIPSENVGFGSANNRAIREIMSAPNPPEAIYLLNPDTITHPGATRALYDALFSDSHIGLVGANLYYADGSFQPGAFAFPGLRQLWVEFFPTPGRLIEGTFNGRYPRALYDAGKSFPVDFVLGATMMLRREVVQQTGMFDEAFFMYCEEIDWAWRIHDAGWRVCTVPAAHVIHLAGQSTSQVRARSIINLWTSRLLLAEKHYPVWKRLLARGMVALGMTLKTIRAPNAELREAYFSVRKQALG
jgi:N-acetylglucosaminyl-diphospho-decaprenol L-rhamnosyltransferase